MTCQMPAVFSRTSLLMCDTFVMFSNCVFCWFHLPNLWAPPPVSLIKYITVPSFLTLSSLKEWPARFLYHENLSPPWGDASRNTWCCSFLLLWWWYHPCWGVSVSLPACPSVPTVQLPFQNLFLPLRNSKSQSGSPLMLTRHHCALHCLNYKNPAREEGWEAFSLT